jgi:hypothetical protein
MGPTYREHGRWRSQVAARFGLGDAAWPGPADFGPGPGLERGLAAVRLVERARRAGCRRIAVLGTSALARKAAQVARANGLDVAAFATCSPLHVGGVWADTPIVRLEAALAAGVDAVLVGESRLTRQWAMIAAAELQRAGHPARLIYDDV